MRPLSLLNNNGLVYRLTLPKKQIRALSNLQKHAHLVTEPLDKGGNIVLMTHLQYQTMCLDVLNNTTRYMP